MGRIYVATMESISVSAAKSIIEFTASSTAIVQLLEAWITQDASETSTQEVAQILRKSAAGTGTAFTARPLEILDPAFAGTVRTNMTAEGTAGNIMRHEGFNILNGWLYVPIPENRIIVPPSGILALKLPNTPAAAITVSAGMIFEEIG